MFEPNVERILSTIGRTDLVLDIGGWARPFNRANFVLDQEPYETRGYYLAPQGGGSQYFDASTWIQRDICHHAPFPFGNKEIDFVICSHTLEDIRDPLWVCSEMIRVGKRGYLEAPSRVAESSRGVEPGQVGWSHHRWLIDVQGDLVTFLQKFHRIHSRLRYSFPARHLRSLPEAARVQWLFWETTFRYCERTIHGVSEIERELEGYVAAVQPYPAWFLALEGTWYRGRRFGERLRYALRRRARPWQRCH